MKNITYINAGAGSGKTHCLTETLTKLIKEGKVKPEQVILTTFTKKAANEFKEKAKAFLFNEGLYEEAILLDDAMIGTIHSVCQRMIGKYWFHLGLSPNMGVMAEEDTAYYISQSLAGLPTDTELKLLHNFARFFDIREMDGYRPKSTIHYNFWQAHLESIIGFATNYELDDFSKSEEESLNYIHQFVKNHLNLSFTFDELKAVVNEHESFLRSRKQSPTNEARIDKLVQVKNRLGHPTLGTLKDINSTIGTPKGYGPLATAFQEKMDGLWTSWMIYEKQEEYIKLIFSLALRWKENFHQFKREKNLLDYNDMEKYMCQLMQDTSIAAEIGQSYRYLFVDEFQDSSPIQVKIFDALSDLMEHSYWVGDYKQAIYGFRGSDIALTKAVVDRVDQKENGCNTDTLDISWRSLPAIVDVNNGVFGKTFAQVLAQDNILLNPYRKNEEGEESLRYFVTKEGAGVAEHILKLLHQGGKPNEIAVLARANASLDDIAKELTRLEIPSSRVECLVTESSVYPLVASLLRIVVSSKDTFSKAMVAYLTEADYTVRKIIETRILHRVDESAKESDYLADVPLVSKLMAICPHLQQQSVASLVESMVIELNLYDVVKKIEGDALFAISCLQTLVLAARTYEEHSVQMNLPATVDGYLSYLEKNNLKISGDPDGVQLHTYHSCKGLQWKYVILTSLNTDVAEINKMVRYEIYGVHAVHTDEPSKENPYPEVFVRLTPWIYGSAKNVPEEVGSIIEVSDAFRQVYQAKLAEENRLLYVGMTRPQDVLMLSIDEPKKGSKLLQWPRAIGMNSSAKSMPDLGDWDVFGTGHMFKDYTLSPAEIEALEPYGEKDEAGCMALNMEKPLSEEEKGACYLSPSKIHGKGEVLSHHHFGQRIPYGQQPSDMAVVGDCIHQIFAGMEEVRPAYQISMEEIIGSYGLSDVLVDQEAIVRAWKNLTEHLAAIHGVSVKTYHERPFRLHCDGQVVTGSMDFVWQTAEGDVLVDFKTCPMGATAILDPESEHYVGHYAGQLDAYTNALQAAGEKVVKRYVYYPVSGLLVEL